MTTQSKQKSKGYQIPDFERNLYYTGKLLTARDLSDEQRYFRDKLRLHYMALHGWGVVCGLRVRPHPYCPDRKVVIEEGFAIDNCGREIRVLECTDLDLPQPPPKPPHKDRPPQAYEEDCKDQPEEPKWKKLYICLRYAECETEQMPAPFDECGCNGNGEKAGRAAETSELSITETKPGCLKGDEDCDDNCRELYWEQPVECSTPGKNCCVLLAVIHRFVPGLPVTEETIDLRHRPVVRSTHQLDRLIRCLIEKLPTRRLTQICAFNWTHATELHCHDFLRQYIGHEKPGFEIEFSNHVNPEGITPRTFQAIVVPIGPEGGHHIEIVPARIHVDHRRCSLEIETEYANQHLRDRDFDLYLTLKCDVIVDEDGFAVDGNLLARLVEEEGFRKYIVTTPTGDGVPGGLFESWIKVRTHVPAS
jgi:hypothetical protein